jgi:hypothetical protein
MAIKHAFTILCENLIQSQHQRLSFIDVFTNIDLKTLPGGIGRFCVAVGFTGSLGDEYSIEIAGPAGDKRKTPVAQGKIDEDDVAELSRDEVGYVIMVGEYQPMIFATAGIHHVVLRSGKKVIHRQPFSVSLRPPSKESADAQTPASSDGGPAGGGDKP